MTLDEGDYLEFYEIAGKLFYILQRFKKVELLLMTEKTQIPIVAEPSKKLRNSLE